MVSKIDIFSSCQGVPPARSEEPVQRCHQTSDQVQLVQRLAQVADEDDNNENLYVITIKTIMMTTDHVQPVQRLAQVD